VPAPNLTTTERSTMNTPTLPIGSIVTVRGLDGPYTVQSAPYAPGPYSGPGVTLEASDGFRFWWNLEDITEAHRSYT